MRVRAIDDNNDWTYGQGQNNYKSGQNAIQQNIQTRLQSFLGDCFFNLAAGIDWFNLLGQKSLLQLQLAISAVILNTEGVSGIVSLNFDLQTDRNLIISYSVTVYGTTQVVVGTLATANFITTEDGDVLTTESGGGLVI